MKPFTTLLCTGMITVGLAACSSTPSRMNTAQSPSPAPMASVDSGQLQQFANAAQRVSAIDQDYAARMQTARPGMGQWLGQEANGKKAHAVNDAGLTVPQFNSIAMAVQQDPTLMRQYSDMMNTGGSAMGGSSGSGNMGGGMGGSGGGMGSTPRY